MTETGRSFLPYGRQSIQLEDIEAVISVLKGDWLTQGPTVERFETALGERVCASETVACSNGTTALHLAAVALDLGPGDSVIVPTVTFLATANAARYVGAEVVFSDVDPTTGLMRQEDLAEAVDRARKQGLKPRAVFPVHLAGQPTDAADIAAELNLHVIEDAAHAVGTTRKRANETSPVGACDNGGMTTFSFHPVKTIATGEGGAVTTNDPQLGERLRRLRSHGMVRTTDQFQAPHQAIDADGRPNPWYYEMTELGFNYRLTDLQCALGLSQLARLDRFVASRQESAARYTEGLAKLAPLVTPLEQSACAASVAWHLYVVQIDFDALGLSRAEVMAEMSKRGVGTQVHYIPVHTQPYYFERYGHQSLPGAAAYYARCLSLPLFHGLTREDTDHVVASLTEIIASR